MSVYVDDMEAKFGRMIMCHMIADTTAELISMANKIGVAGEWIQYPATPKEHFDIAKSKRSLAISHGAIPITWRQAGAMYARRLKLGYLGSPNDAEQWLRSQK